MLHILDGDGRGLPGLAALPDLQRWGAVLHCRSLTLELQDLDTSVSMVTENGQMVTSVLNFDDEFWLDPLLKPFMIQQAETSPTVRKVFLASHVTGEVPNPILQVLLAEGRQGVVKREVKLKMLDSVRSLAHTVQYLYDSGRTVMIEVFSGEGHLTIRCLQGGHICGQPLDIRYSIDLRDAVALMELCEWVHKMRPWLVTIAFPCTAYSRLQTYLNRHLAPRFEAQRKAEYVWLVLTRDLALIQADGGRLEVLPTNDRSMKSMVRTQLL